LAGDIYNRRKLEQQACNLIESRNKIEHDSWESEPQINARTALFEALTAKGHLSRVEFPGQIDDVNQKTLERLLNGWSDAMPVWEQARRLNEVTEELTIQSVYQDVKSGKLPIDTIVITISNYPEDAPEHQATQVGYGVLNQKGMVRTTTFENDIRILEQGSRSNSNDGSAERFFAAQGFAVGKGATRLLANQIIATKRDFPDGVVDIQRALDHFCGPHVIYGENRFQDDLDVPEYHELRKISASREDQAETFIKKLEEFERSLNLDYKSGKIDYNQKLVALNKRRKELVAEICVLAPNYAKDAIGAAAAKHIKQASYAMASGDDAAGAQYMESAISAADPRAGAVCGGNGLSNLSQTQTASQAEAQRLYLEAKDERKKWKWEKGVCIVQECPSRPTKTEVGPCSVCRKCQTVFDNGENPKSVYKTLGFLDILFESIREFNQKYAAEQSQKKAIELARQKAEGEKLPKAA